MISVLWFTDYNDEFSFVSWGLCDFIEGLTNLRNYTSLQFHMFRYLTRCHVNIVKELFFIRMAVDANINSSLPKDVAIFFSLYLYIDFFSYIHYLNVFFYLSNSVFACFKRLCPHMSCIPICGRSEWICVGLMWAWDAQHNTTAIEMVMILVIVCLFAEDAMIER
jgi:hypothetical protein